MDVAGLLTDLILLAFTLIMFAVLHSGAAAGVRKGELPLEGLRFVRQNMIGILVLLAIFALAALVT